MKNQSTELTITTKKTMELVIDTIRQLPEGKWTVKIFPWIQKRTDAQNRLMWKWIGEIGEYLGWEKKAVHFYFKETFLIPIRERDDPEFARTLGIINRMDQRHIEREMRRHRVEICLTRIKISFKNDLDIALFAEDVALLYKKNDDHVWIRKWVIEEISTTKLNVKQKSEYLTHIKRFAHENGANITIPPDKELKWLCGIK